MTSVVHRRRFRKWPARRGVLQHPKLANNLRGDARNICARCVLSRAPRLRAQSRDMGSRPARKQIINQNRLNDSAKSNLSKLILRRRRPRGSGI